MTWGRAGGEATRRQLWDSTEAKGRSVHFLRDPLLEAAGAEGRQQTAPHDPVCVGWNALGRPPTDEFAFHVGIPGCPRTAASPQPTTGATPNPGQSLQATPPNPRDPGPQPRTLSPNT
eukprot:2165181-Rhodomonas_salina.1